MHAAQPHRWLSARLTQVAAVFFALLMAFSLLPSAALGENFAHRASAEQSGVTLIAEYNDPVAGQPMTFHVSATGGPGQYKFYMGATSYTDADGSFEILDDPTRVGGYTDACTSYGYSFTPTASGTYTFEFDCMWRPSNDARYMTQRLKFQVVLDDPAHPSVAAIVANTAQQCRRETDDSQYAMALWMHDWLIDHMDYDSSLKWCSAWSGLTLKTGTCESYWSAYTKLLNAVGIESGRVTGNGHVWNAVKIDGQWTQIDATWDDNSSATYTGVSRGDVAQRHLYFGLTDELMAYAHSDHAKNYQAAGYAYRSTSLANNYYVRAGAAKTWAESYRSRIQEQLDAGKTEFSIQANNRYDPPSIAGIVDGIMLSELSQMSLQTGGKAVQLTPTLVSTGAASGYDVHFVVTQTVDPEPEPQPQPEPTPDPTPEPTPEPQPTPQPDPTPTPEPQPQPQPQPTPTPVQSQDMYRLYNPNSGEHFYTASVAERDNVVRAGWRYEGVGWKAPTTGDPVYRLYNPNAGDHHYTTSAAERDHLVSVGWRYEGIGWYSGGSTPLYRQYNPNARAGAHNFTTSQAENNHLVSVGWRAEGIGWYGVG